MEYANSDDECYQAFIHFEQADRRLGAALYSAEHRDSMRIVTNWRTNAELKLAIIAQPILNPITEYTVHLHKATSPHLSYYCGTGSYQVGVEPDDELRIRTYFYSKSDISCDLEHCRCLYHCEDIHPGKVCEHKIPLLTNIPGMEAHYVATSCPSRRRRYLVGPDWVADYNHWLTDFPPTPKEKGPGGPSTSGAAKAE